MDGKEASLVPGKEHYDSAYLGADFVRMFSYQKQIAMAVRDLKPKRVLVVGVGDGLVVDALRRGGIEVITLDICEELNPDLVANVSCIPLPDRSVNVAICCQVLEHIPFDKINAAMQELGRVASNRIIVSVPDQRRYIGGRLSIFGRKYAFELSPPRFRGLTFESWRLETMGHYWEVGFREWPVSVVKRALGLAGWSAPRLQRVPDLPWHLFAELNRNA